MVICGRDLKMAKSKYSFDPHKSFLHKSFLFFKIIALSHIHVSAAYRSRIYENVDTPRSEPYFARETYVPRTCDVPATFPWRICIRMEFHFRMYGVSMRMRYVRVTYVWTYV